MRHRDAITAVAASFFFAAGVHAANSNSQYLIDQIVHGGPGSIRSAAESIYQMHETDRAILDVLAETLLQKYPTARDNDMADAMAWACKGLAAGGDKRYFSAVKEAADSDAAHRSVRRHCSRAADDLRGPEGQQYSKGTVSLAEVAAKMDALKTSPGNLKRGDAPAPAGNHQPITEVKVGMSMEQAYDIAGYPTNTASYQTGKAFIPFNFKGNDVVRTAALYKGQGRIVFNNDNRYSGTMRVLEVIVNPNESGYP